MTKDCAAIFDLGGVVIDWNPRYLYRKLFNGNETAMEYFLAAVCTSSWNAQQDAGRPFADGYGSLKRLHPDKAKLIDAWFERYGERSLAQSTFSENCGRGVYRYMYLATGLRRRSLSLSIDSNA